MKNILSIITLALISTSAFSVEAPYNIKCSELGGEPYQISCHQIIYTYQDDKYNSMIAELEKACLVTSKNDPGSFVVSDVWKFDGDEKYDIRSYCMTFN